MKQPSLVLLYCYFGKLPWYFPLFVNSCRYNTSIDFRVYTDQDYSVELPENFKVIKITQKEFKILADRKIGFPVNLDYSYKLCDLKPAYGLVFEDDIQKYEYWGMGDVDVIFGDIRKFITNLDEVDVFCVRYEYVTGYFSIFKNSEYVKNLFKKSKDYIKVFQSGNHYCFDECNFQFTTLGAGVSIFDTAAEIESMTHVVSREHQNGNLKIHFDMHAVEGLPGNLRFSEGILSYRDKFEVLLYHLIAFKKHPLLLKPVWTEVPLEYKIHKHFLELPGINGGIRSLFKRIKILLKSIKNTLSFFKLYIISFFTKEDVNKVELLSYHGGSVIAKLSLADRRIQIDFTDSAVSTSMAVKYPVLGRPQKIKFLRLTRCGANCFISLAKFAVVRILKDLDRKSDYLEISLLNKEGLKFYHKK